MYQLKRTVALVGMMGAGKSSVGRRLAAKLGVPFRDADSEIEAAAGCTVAEIFERFGEQDFRDGERRVIARLLGQPPHVLATGGGAFMDAGTRDVIARRGVSVWLRADLDVLMVRVSRRSNRPLLQEPDPRAVMAALIERRYPIYAEADLTVDSGEGPLEQTVTRVVGGLAVCNRALQSPEGETWG
jgi:shikimate kinase